MNVRCYLREYRERQDVGLRTFAERLNINAGRLSELERGQAFPHDDLIPRLEEAYAHPVSEWYDWRGPLVVVEMDERKPAARTAAAA